ncbi:MAG: class I SAM-dependent methyltransferase [Candidatus Paceibacterota bacterium]
MTTQVEKEHYNFEKYGHVGRWVSYHHQLKEVLLCNPSSILEIGVGDKVFGSYIKNNTTISYTSFDTAEDLHPDIVGDITKPLPFGDTTFDVVCAFEVLEHIPFEQVEGAIREMVRVSKKGIVVSVPHFSHPLKFLLKIPLVKEIAVAFRIPHPKEHTFNGEHYWELGKKGYSVERLLTLLKKYGAIKKHFVPFGYQYHHFFVLEKK